MGTFRVKENSALHQAIDRISDLMDKEGLRIEVSGNQMFIIYKEQEYKFCDLDSGDSITEFPPAFEYKLTFEQ